MRRWRPLLAPMFLFGCATAEQNMAEQQKLRLVPGKQIYATGPNYQFCEVALFYGTSPENAVAVFYNPTTGTEHCTPGTVRPDREGQGADHQGQRRKRRVPQPHPLLDVGRILGL